MNQQYVNGPQDLSAPIEMTPEMKAAVQKVQKGYATKMRRDALKAIRQTLEGCDDVADVLKYSGGLQVAMMNGAILRVEIVAP